MDIGINPGRRPYYEDANTLVYQGDCRDVIAGMPDGTIDAVVTDPPYGLEFMGEHWDAPWRESAESAGTGRGSGLAFQRWCESWLVECLRVLKPGGYLVAFGGTRTWHRLTAAAEDTGFEIRDSIAWLTGQGFPKSVRLTSDSRFCQCGTTKLDSGGICPACGKPVVDGLGTALKPAFEPIVVARKPMVGSTGDNVLSHGTGAMNIDGCRIEAGKEYRDKCASVVGLSSNRTGAVFGEWTGVRTDSGHDAGRWPTNVALSHMPLLDAHDGTVIGDACANGCVADCPVAQLDATNRVRSQGHSPRCRSGLGYGSTSLGTVSAESKFGRGGVSRYFPSFRYESKAPASERPTVAGVQHRTVKPLALMRWLVRLCAPSGAVVLDPFAGSGTTAEACLREYKCCIAIEREVVYLPLIAHRLTRHIEMEFDFGTSA